MVFIDYISSSDVIKERKRDENTKEKARALRTRPQTPTEQNPR